MWGATADGEESGGAAGWSIADGSRNSNGSSWNTDSSESYYIRVNGTARTALPLLSIADASGSEGGDITFTATLSAASGRTVTANWTASVESGDTAASGDLSGTLTGTLTFAPGEGTKTFTVATAEDTTDEDDETFTVTLTGLAYTTLGDATATGTIDDDDDPPTLRVGSVGILEGQTAIFSPALSAESGKTVTATWTASVESGDTAESADLRGTLTGILTFDPGETSQRIFIATVDDSLDEVYETFTVTLTGVANATAPDATGQGGISDNDAAPTLSIADASGSEGGDIAFTATLSAASGKTVTTTWTASVESGDTAASGDLSGTLTGTLTFAPGDLASTFTVATAEDTDDEDDETFTVTLSGLSNATLTGGAATGTIEDNEAARTLRIADASGSEGNSITFTVTLEPASVRTVTANWTASVESGDTAASGDLRGALTGTLTFAPGEGTKTFRVATAEDTADEDEETFTVTLSGPANATLGDATATGTIIDDDYAPGMDIENVNVDEGDTANFTATLRQESGKTVTVNWTASLETGDTAESADLGSTLSGTLVFDPGETSKPVAVATAEDLLDEDSETFTVTLTGGDNATTTDATAQGTIIDDDAAPALSVADASGSEGDSITFMATLSAASAKPVTATWTASVVSGDTAASGDLSGTLTGTLTFAAGDLTKTFTVATAEDTTDEPDETFTVTLSNLSNATLTSGTATGTIEDDDGAAVLSVADASAAEGSAITFTVTLEPASAQTVTVDYATSVAPGDTATTGDFTAKSGSLSFGPGDTEKTFTVATAGDAADEVDETFTVTLSGPANATLGDATATGTIDDDDDPPTLSVADASRSEGDAVSFTATLSAASGQTVTATWTASVESGDTAASGDLSGTLTGILTFAAGEGTRTFTVATAEDTSDEDDETFTVTLSNLSNATLTGGTATGTIIDDDAAPALSVADAGAAEGDAVSFTATLSAASGQTVTATWTASVESGDTAASGDLSGALTGTLTFAAGDLTKTFTVATAEDTTDEPDETFTVTLSNLSNATLTGGTATGTIEDDDGAAVLRIADASAAEGQCGHLHGDAGAGERADGDGGLRDVGRPGRHRGGGRFHGEIGVAVLRPGGHREDPHGGHDRGCGGRG